MFLKSFKKFRLAEFGAHAEYARRFNSLLDELDQQRLSITEGGGLRLSQMANGQVLSVDVKSSAAATEATAMHPFQIYQSNADPVSPTTDWRTVRIYQGEAWGLPAFTGAQSAAIVVPASTDFYMIYGEITNAMYGVPATITIKAKAGKELFCTYPGSLWRSTDVLRFLIGVVRTSDDDDKQLQIVQAITENIDEQHPVYTRFPFKLYAKFSSDTAFDVSGGTGAIATTEPSNKDTAAFAVGATEQKVWIKINFDTGTNAVTSVEYQSGTTMPANPTPTNDGLIVPYIYLAIGTFIKGGKSASITAFTEQVPTPIDSAVIINQLNVNLSPTLYVTGYSIGATGVAASLNIALMRVA